MSLIWSDATAQAELVRSGQATPGELLEAAITRIEALDGGLNAVIHRRFERARVEADAVDRDAPFAGVPMVLKDLICELEDEPFHEGMAYLRDLDYRAPADQGLARRFKQAGFVVVGKSNTPELGGIPTTEPLSHGPTRNPWDRGRTPGGSSGGSAAAVATGMVAVGHANDAGGSIRNPAARCGLVGLKPSRGRISQGPLYGDVFGGVVAELAVTRTVRDSAALLDVLSAPFPGDPIVARARPIGTWRRCRRRPARCGSACGTAYRAVSGSCTPRRSLRSTPAPSCSAGWATPSRRPTPTSSSAGSPPPCSVAS